MLFPFSRMFMHLYPCPLSFCESNCSLSARILHGFPLHLQDLIFPKLLTSIPVNVFTSFQISCIIKLLPVLTFKKMMENSEGSVLSRRERYPSSLIILLCSTTSHEHHSDDCDECDCNQILHFIFSLVVATIMSLPVLLSM